ncbi:MAG: porin [Pseudomonadota bacterium]
MITGEKPSFQNGILQPIIPLRSLWKEGWGGLGLALRYDHFAADDAVYHTLIDPEVSVREADAFSAAINWYISPVVRLVFDYTRTEFDRPLLIGRDGLSGTAIYSDREDVFTTRFQLGF